MKNDLILMDIQMPILAMTANAFAEDKQEAINKKIRFLRETVKIIV